MRTNYVVDNPTSRRQKPRKLLAYRQKKTCFVSVNMFKLPRKSDQVTMNNALLKACYTHTHTHTYDQCALLDQTAILLFYWKRATPSKWYIRNGNSQCQRNATQLNLVHLIYSIVSQIVYIWILWAVHAKSHVELKIFQIDLNIFKTGIMLQPDIIIIIIDKNYSVNVENVRTFCKIKSVFIVNTKLFLVEKKNWNFLWKII